MSGGPGACLQGYELQLMDASGKMYPQRVHERSFSAFEASGMILLHKRSKGAEATLDDMPMSGWQHLQQVHEAAVKAASPPTYQLYPRRCKTTRAFEVMLSICAQPNSPFKLSDRYDPVEAKQIFRAKEIDTLKDYNNTNPYKYTMFNTIYFDGILASQRNKQVAFIMTQQQFTYSNIHETHKLLDFLKFWIPKAHTDSKNTAEKYSNLLKLCNDKPFIVTAAESAPQMGDMKNAMERGSLVMQRHAVTSMRFLFLK